MRSGIELDPRGQTVKEEGRVVGVKKLFEWIKSSWDHKSCRDLLALKFDYFNLCSQTAKRKTGKLLGVVSLQCSVRFHQGGFKTSSSYKLEVRRRV